jgi:hypothetical protein
MHAPLHVGGPTLTNSPLALPIVRSNSLFAELRKAGQSLLDSSRTPPEARTASASGRNVGTPGGAGSNSDSDEGMEAGEIPEEDLREEDRKRRAASAAEGGPSSKVPRMGTAGEQSMLMRVFDDVASFKEQRQGQDEDVDLDAPVALKSSPSVSGERVAAWGEKWRGIGGGDGWEKWGNGGGGLLGEECLMTSDGWMDGSSVVLACFSCLLADGDEDEDGLAAKLRQQRLAAEQAAEATGADSEEEDEGAQPGAVRWVQCGGGAYIRSEGRCGRR